MGWWQVTVKELMGLLAEFNQDIPVLVDGYEGGFDVPHVEGLLAVRPARPEQRKPWQGRYARHLETEGLAFKAVVVRRLVHEPGLREMRGEVRE